MREFLAVVTGVSADAEKQRIDDQQEEEEPGQFDSAPLQGANPADLAAAQAEAQKRAGVENTPSHNNTSPADFIAGLQRGGNNAK